MCIRDRSKATSNDGAIMQGYKASLLFLVPMLWPLTDTGYQYNSAGVAPLKEPSTQNVPIVTMKELS